MSGHPTVLSDVDSEPIAESSSTCFQCCFAYEGSIIFARLLLTVTFGLLVSGCDDFDGEPFRKLLPKAHSKAPVVAAERKYLNCALAAFRVSPDPEFLNYEIYEGFQDWHELPFGAEIHENSIVYRVLSSSDKCWTEDLKVISGSESLWDHIENPNRYYSYWGPILMVYDPKRNLLITAEG